MILRLVLLPVLALAVSATVAGSACADAPGIRPNIILVFIDDMGWGDLSCFGNREIGTANIDMLAREGIAFEQFYVNAPICSPSRVAISTGQYPQRWNITSYLDDRETNTRRGVAQWLDPRAPMLARDLQAAGYATGHFGKWHMGGQRDVTDAPQIAAYGFDESLTNFEGLGPKLLPLVMEPGWSAPRKIWEKAEILGGPARWTTRSEITGEFVGAAIQFMDKAAASGKPFYINVWPDDVHSPFYPSLDHWAANSRARYLAVLREMDVQLGALFDHVRDNPGLGDNTLIILCSDNGPEPGAGDAGPFRGSKATLFEGGIRSPLIVWGPVLTNPAAAGTRNKRAVFAAIDLVPSILDICQVEPRANVCRDGRSVIETLLGRSDKSNDRPYFFSRPPDRKDYMGQKRLPDLAVRKEQWKLLCDDDGGRPMLFDLASDPGERNNVAASRPEIVKSMTESVTEWYGEIGAKQ